MAKRTVTYVTGHMISHIIAPNLQVNLLVVYSEGRVMSILNDAQQPPALAYDHVPSITAHIAQINPWIIYHLNPLFYKACTTKISCMAPLMHASLQYSL